MIAEIVDIEKTESIFFKKNLEKFPHLANKNPDDLPACFFEEVLISHEEFMEYFEKRLFERLGIKVDLSSSSVDDDDDTPLFSPEEELRLRKACEKWENERNGAKVKLSYLTE